eukprot:Seg1208.8 transcript_id=Seg1208.8/GoldUCD/mRNA.D3Y31 product="1-phosphatidylinositol 4 5-bisphosphate phosphodiesterase beta-1" protein_id=Seg1208.8/GoldUCD/D3Y31
MAGAGVVAETLKQVTVAPILLKTSKFLKWDDQDTNASIAYDVQVDPKGHILYWKPEDYSKDTEVLELVLIRDVRIGQYAKSPKNAFLREALKSNATSEDEATSVQERTISVCYGPTMVDVSFTNFVAASIAEAREWGNSLLAIIGNLLDQNTSPLRCLERFFTRISVLTAQDGNIPAKTIVKYFSTSKDDKKRAYDALLLVGLASGKKDIINVADLTFEKFIDFYHRLCPRQDLDKIFGELGVGKKPYMTVDQLVDFLNNTQRDPRLNEILYPYYNTARAQNIIQTHEKNQDFVKKGYMSIEGLTKYLMSDDNLVITPERFIPVHQDMTAPLSHYFINSSHNTYLTGHQLTGRSSVEIYRQVLLAGCRCIELDCWDGKTEEQEPIITHGMTLCTEVPFKDVVEAIAESAFKTSEFPVILSFENHCSGKQQAKMANYCQTIFADMLLSKPLDEYPLDPGKPLPSLKSLKRKILIKNKKHTAKENDNPHQHSTKNENNNDENIEEEAEPKSPENEEAPEKEENEATPSEKENTPTDASPKEATENDPEKEENEEEVEVEAEVELSALVNYIQPVHFRGFDNAETRQRYFEMSSFSENSATNLLKEQPINFVNYNKLQLSRIYPKGGRVSSDNYMPQVFWNSGCQLVALNFQTLDLPMMLNLGKFEINGRCGYLLKPDFMCRSDRTFDPFVESTVDGIIAGTISVKVISGQCLTEKKTGTYVEVDMFGLPADTVRRKFRTKVIQNNGLNPIYDEEPFLFKKVILPSLAVLRIAAYEEGGKLIGHRVLPVHALNPGYRHIKLRNECYQPMCLPTLFVNIVTKDFVPSNFADFADALANPIQYLSENEKRTQQLEALLMDEDAEDSTDAEPVVQKQELKPPKTQAKRTSIISLSFGGSKQEHRESVPNLRPVVKSVSDTFSNRNSDRDLLPAGRTKSLQPIRSNSVDAKPSRSKSTSGEHMKGIREDLLELKPPSLEELKQGKTYAKLKARFENEMGVILQRQLKEKMKIAKEFESQLRKVKSVIEKDKTTVQRKHSKTLKKAEKNGNYENTYKVCLEEISVLNTRQEEEVTQIMNKHKEKLKTLYKEHYFEQMNFAKGNIIPEFMELRKIIETSKANDIKKQQDRHIREMQVLKKDQDRYNRNELKMLGKEYRNKGELQRMKREHNKKHIEQAVVERQKMKEYQEKEMSDLSKQYEDFLQEVITLQETAPADLESLYEKNCSELESESVDLSNFTPVLFQKGEVSATATYRNPTGSG